jgi:tetratricopeptide (TPR) repeat protein
VPRALPGISSHEVLGEMTPASLKVHQAAFRPRIATLRSQPVYGAGRIDVHGASVWLLTFAIVLYLALNGGGYDSVVRNQVGIAVWWGVLVTALLGLLPVGRIGLMARVSVLLLGAFVVWTGVAASWSASIERSFEQLSLIACYLGFFVVGICIHRDRERAIRQTLGAVAAAVALVALLAVLSRLRPSAFPNAQQTAALLPNTKGRLSWPLNYWNGLGALMALGLPLLLAVATSARRLLLQAAAAGAAPVVALCGYLTFSRGGAAAAAVGLIVFFALTRERVVKLLTALLIAAGSTIVIAGAVHRSAVEKGLTDAAAGHQGRQLLVVVAFVCVGTALAQVAIALAARHATGPRWLSIPPARARAALAVAVVVAIAAGVAAGGPGWLSRRWQEFKRPTAANLNAYGPGRFGAANGNGRYQLWQAAADAADQKLLTGWGPGTYALLWPPRASQYDPVQNAHSLYLETLAEEGVPGLALLVVFLGLVVGGAISAAVRARHEARTQAAAAAAVCCAFLISAAIDWVWQLPVLAGAFLLLGAATLGPVAPRVRVRSGTIDADDLAEGTGSPGIARGPWAVRGALALVALVCLALIALPLAETTALRDSRSAAASGATATALTDAQTAARIEPGAASPQLQLALVLETQDRLASAVLFAQRATRDEPLNWGAWLVLSRLESEAGQPRPALQAYERARSLNPRSPLFKL